MKPGAIAFCLCLQLVGVASGDSLYVRLVGHQSSYFPYSGVAVEGEYAYVASGGLYVISVVDPTHPLAVGYCGSVGRARGVAVAGDYAYVADDSSNSLRVVSIADPAHPVLVGSCATPDHAVKVAVRGQFAYVAANSDFCVVSIADPQHPVMVGHLPGGNSEYNLDVRGDYAYVADISAGLRIISIADPADPTQVGFFAGSARAVAVSADLAYIGCDDGSFRAIDVSDPANPIEIGRTDNIRGVDYSQDLAAAHGYAFVATWSGGLGIVSIADLTHISEAAFYRIGQTSSLAREGRYAYVTAGAGLYVLEFFQLGDLDIDPDSSGVVADTLRLREWVTNPGDSIECAYGEFVLVNTSTSFNPDTTDGPSVSPVDSVSFSGVLTGPGGSIDSISIPNLPHSLSQGQAVVCTLAARMPVGLQDGDYTGTAVISGKDTAGLLVQDSCYLQVKKHGDADVDPDSLDVVADTIRARPWLVSAGPPTTYSDYAYGEFILVNTTESFNPDTTDGPSRSPVRSLRFSGSLSGPHGTIDSILIPNLPQSLEIGQAVVCTLAVYVPPGLPEGDYSGPIVIRSDSLQPQIAETVYVLVRKLGDLDVAGDSLGVVNDTMNLHAQPAGPVYSPYAKAPFLLVNTGSAYNPDAEDGPSRSTLREVEVEVKVEAESVYVLNLPESLAVGQAVECTLALVLPVGTPTSGYTGVVTISAVDTAGYEVQDSFFLVVHGPQPRQNLDSLRVAPIPFKPNQNPEHDAIHFQGLSAGARATVYDASGQTVWTATEHGDGHLEWDAKVASGIYVYLVVSADGSSSKVGKLSVIR
jgi:hypothetical protein